MSHIAVFVDHDLNYMDAGCDLAHPAVAAKLGQAARGRQIDRIGFHYHCVLNPVEVAGRYPALFLRHRETISFSPFVRQRKFR